MLIIGESGPPVISGGKVCINFNNETGKDIYSVEYVDDIGNWIDSFLTQDEAEVFIKSNNLGYDSYSGFRDTRAKYRALSGIT